VLGPLRRNFKISLLKDPPQSGYFAQSNHPFRSFRPGGHRSEATLGYLF